MFILYVKFIKIKIFFPYVVLRDRKLVQSLKCKVMPISSGIILLQHLFIIAAAHTIRYKSHYIFARSAGAIMIVSVQIKASVPATCLEEIAGPTYTIWDITRPLHFCPIHTNRLILQTCMCVIKILKKKEKNL